MKKFNPTKPTTIDLCGPACTYDGYPCHWHLRNEPSVTESGFEANIVKVSRTQQRCSMKENQTSLARGTGILIDPLTHPFKQPATFSSMNQRSVGTRIKPWKQRAKRCCSVKMAVAA